MIIFLKWHSGQLLWRMNRRGRREWGSGGHNWGRKTNYEAHVVFQVGNDRSELNSQWHWEWGEGGRSWAKEVEWRGIGGSQKMWWWRERNKPKVSQVSNSHLEKGWSASQRYQCAMGRETEALRGALMKLTQCIRGRFGLEPRNPYSWAREGPFYCTRTFSGLAGRGKHHME